MKVCECLKMKSFNALYSHTITRILFSFLNNSSVNQNAGAYHLGKKVNRARAWRGLFLKSLLLWWSREKNPSSCLGISSYAPLQKNSFLLLKHTNYCVNGRAMLCACICKCVCIFISSRLIFWKAVKSSLKVTQQIQENILIGCCRRSLPKSSII